MTETPAEEEAEIKGATTLFGVASGDEEEGTIIGATTPPESAVDLEEHPLLIPTTEPIPVSVAKEAAETAPPEAPWTQIAAEARTLLNEAEDEMKKLEGDKPSGNT